MYVEVSEFVSVRSSVQERDEQTPQQQGSAQKAHLEDQQLRRLRRVPTTNASYVQELKLVRVLHRAEQNRFIDITIQFECKNLKNVCPLNGTANTR